MALYAPTLRADFRWDDELLIRSNYALRSWKNAALAFARPLYKFPLYYRPLQILSYRIDYVFWGSNPFGYHLTNLVLHLINMGSVYGLLLLLSRRRTLAFAGACLFGIHPVMTEPVNYLSSRSDLLVGLFTLLTYLFYLRADVKEKPCRALSLASFTLALLSKESAIAIPFALLAYALSREQRPFSKILPYFAIGALFLILKQAVVPLQTTRPFLTQPLLALPGLFFLYLSAVAFPLNIYKSIHISTALFADPPIFAGAIACLLVFVYLLKKTSRANALVALGLGWFSVHLAPFLAMALFSAKEGIAPFSYAWLYIPGIGICLAAAVFFEALLLRYPRFHYAAKALFSVVLTLLSVATLRQNALWAGTDRDFFLDTITRKPQMNPSEIYVIEGSDALQRGDEVRAEAMFLRALKINPEDKVALANLGALNYRRGRLEKALGYFNRCLSLSPDSVEMRYDIGLICLKQGNKKAAAEEFRKVVAADPFHVDAHYNLAILYAQENNETGALREAEILRELDPASYRALIGTPENSTD